MKFRAHHLFTCAFICNLAAPQGQNTFSWDYKCFTNVNVRHGVLLSGSVGLFQNLKYGVKGKNMLVFKKDKLLKIESKLSHKSIEFELNWIQS